MSVTHRAKDPPAPLGERLIVAYKFGKAALEAVGAMVLWLAVAAGLAGRIVDAAVVFGRHSVHPLAVRLIHWISSEATPTHLHVVAALLGGDAVVSAAEGWVLRRRYPWGRWVVVLATSALLPVELYEILRRPSVGRALVLLINGAIVLYLVSRARRRPAHR